TDDTRLDDVVDTINNNSGRWSEVPDLTIDPEKYPDIQPSKPVITAEGVFATVKLNWDYAYGEFYTQAFEVYVSEVQGSTASPENLIFRGLINGYNFVGETNKQYYFRVKAINFHGRASVLSDEVSATTARVVSDDILFGEEIAAELRELSKKAEILAGDTIGIDKMKQEALDAINEKAKQYTDEEIQETEKEINEELANKAGLNYVEGRFTLVDSDLADLLDEMEDLEEYASSIDQKTDSISFNVSALTQTVDENTTSISNAESSITQLSDSIYLKVEETQAQVDTIDDEVTSVSSQVSELKVDVDGISTSVKSLESDIDNLDVRVRSSESSITQLSTSIVLKAEQEEVNSLTGRMTQAEASLSVHADRIESKVEKDGIISSINQSAESVKIEAAMIELTGDVYMTDGTTYISKGAVGELAIDNGVIKRAHLDKAIIGSAQIDEAVITDAHINDLSADKINVGELSGITISGVTIKGSVFKSVAQDSTFELNGGDMKLDNSNGQSVTISPDGIKGYNSNGDIRFQADRSQVTSSAIGTSNTNIYLGSHGETRSVNYSSLPGNGSIHDYIFTPVRASGFYGNFWNVNPIGATNIYARPLGELRVTRSETLDHYMPVRASGFYGNFWNINPIGAATHIYARPLGELRVTRSETLDHYMPVRASGFYGSFIDHSGGGIHLYARPSSGGNLRVTVRGTTDTWRPVEAAEFSERSLERYKTDIAKFEGSALEIIRQSDIYSYRLIDDVNNGIDRIKHGFIIGDGYRTPTQVLSANRESVDLYAIPSLNWHATKELSFLYEGHDERINYLEMENALLKAELKQIKERLI
ncbi:tail fiber domain-containing protein, partial [Jeotgalibacillus marinus]